MKHLALDIGNVLCHVNFDKFLKLLSKSLNITISDSWHFLRRVQKLHDLGLTNLSDELVDHFQIKSETIIEEILQEWDNCIIPDHDVLNEIARLKNTYNLKVALLSNIGSEHANYIRTTISKDYPIFNESMQFFSCDVGARKPTMLYYHTFLQINPEFNGCVYLDDLQENITSSQKFGIEGHKFVLSEHKSDLNSNNDAVLEFFKNLEKRFV